MALPRILIVEDDAVTSLALSDTLQELKYQVIGCAMSGDEAIALADTAKPDLILMDIHLKGAMDGITAAARIWDKNSIPIVFLTAFADEEILSRVKLTKPFGFILKPYKDLDLNATIQIALENFNSNQRNKKSTGSSLTKSTQDPLDSIRFGTSNISPFEFLKRIDPIRELPENVLSELANGCCFRQFKKNDILTQEQDDNKSCFIVASGRIALLKTSSVGKELTVALLPPGDVFGVAMALDDIPSPYTLLAQGDTTVLSIPANLLRLTLSDFPQLYKEFHEEMTERIQRSHAFALRLAHERVEIRIAAALLELLADFGSKKAGESSHTISITRQQLSQIAGTTPETTIRVTRAMEEQKILNLTRPGIIEVLKIEPLEALISDF